MQGLVPTAIYDHYLATRDAAWLREAFPALNGTAFATVASRAACNCSGLMAAGGGDGGLPSGHIYVQETGALFGIKVAAGAATLLGYKSTAAALNAEFASFRSALLASIHANPTAVDGYTPVIPMYPGQTTAGMEQSNWGAVDLVYPFPLIAFNSSHAAASTALWSSPERTDAYGLHLKLGYSKKPWAYLSADVGYSARSPVTPPPHTHTHTHARTHARTRIHLLEAIDAVGEPRRPCPAAST